MNLTLPNGERAVVTRHCLELYARHVRPALEHDPTLLLRDLQRVCDLGAIALEPPGWYVGDAWRDWHGVPRWLIAGDIAVLLVFDVDTRGQLLAAAALARGCVPDSVREGRTHRHRGRRVRKRMSSDGSNRNQNKEGRRRRREGRAPRRDDA